MTGTPYSSYLRDEARRWGANGRGSAAVEFALIAPPMLMLMAIVVFAGQGFELQRKVTLTLRTLTDLATQQTNIGASSTSYTYSQILNAASLVVAPYDSSQVSIALAEIKTSGTTTGSLQWCQTSGPNANLCPAASPAVPASLASSGYVIYGVVQYNYTPLGIWFNTGAITLSQTIYMSPRASTSVACCT